MGRHAQREGQGDFALGGLVHECEVVPVSIEIRAGMIGWSCDCKKFPFELRSRS